MTATTASYAPVRRRQWVIVALLSLPAGCSDKLCLAYGHAPPAAQVTLVDVSTGEPLCEHGAVTASRGGVALFPEVCQYAITTWFPTDEAGAGVMVFAEGYEPVNLAFDVERNDCGEIQRPADQVVELTPASDGSGGAGGTTRGGGGVGGNAAGAGGVDAGADGG